MPAGLYALEGVTGSAANCYSRRRSVEAIYSFENWVKRFFQIHASFKFLTLVFERRQTSDQSFPAAFMLRDEGFLALPEKEREARSVTHHERFHPAHESRRTCRSLNFGTTKSASSSSASTATVPPLSKKLDRDGALERRISPRTPHDR